MFFVVWCVCQTYCGLSVKINTCEMPLGAQKSWTHIVCLCFHVYGQQKNLNTPNWSSMADNAITLGNIGGPGSPV